MPKQKTHKSSVKRFKLTGSGAVLAQHANRDHRKRFKSTRAKQRSTQRQVIDGQLGKNIRKVIS